jgi:hypothetical protein
MGPGSKGADYSEYVGDVLLKPAQYRYGCAATGEQDGWCG